MFLVKADRIINGRGKFQVCHSTGHFSKTNSIGGECQLRESTCVPSVFLSHNGQCDFQY